MKVIVYSHDISPLRRNGYPSTQGRNTLDTLVTLYLSIYKKVADIIFGANGMEGDDGYRLGSKGNLE